MKRPGQASSYEICADKDIWFGRSLSRRHQYFSQQSLYWYTRFASEFYYRSDRQGIDIDGPAKQTLVFAFERAKFGQPGAEQALQLDPVV